VGNVLGQWLPMSGLRSSGCVRLCSSRCRSAAGSFVQRRTQAGGGSAEGPERDPPAADRPISVLVRHSSSTGIAPTVTCYCVRVSELPGIAGAVYPVRTMLAVPALPVPASQLPLGRGAEAGWLP
jgi:hypothetical protein